MTSEFDQLCNELLTVLKNAYGESVTIPEAEKLAAKFLYAQMILAEKLRDADLDARMRKSGVKAVKAAVYMEAATKTERKPSDVMLAAVVDLSDIVSGEQKSLDIAEVEVDLLQNYYNTFKEGHIFFRGIAKGRFE